MLNKELILKVADEIEKEEEEFDMSETHDTCGSPLCVAGYTLFLLKGECFHELINDPEE